MNAKNTYALSDDKVSSLTNYINNNFIKRKTINTNHTSYWYKHLLENELGFYISNDDFKTAMIECGFRWAYAPSNHNNMMFNVSERCLKK